METGKLKQVKIDFGGGKANKFEGFQKCDILTGDDIIFGGVDFEKDTLPFENESVDEAACSHTLEHIRNTRHFLNELHRVMKKDAVIRFIVPYGTWVGSYKPVHVNQITECWFDFLRKKNSTSVYGYKRWDIKEFVFKRTKEGEIYELEAFLAKL